MGMSKTFSSTTARKPLIYILLFFIIYISDSMIFKLNANSIYLLISRVITVFSFALLIAISFIRRDKIKKTHVQIFVLLFTLGILNQLVFGLKLDTFIYSYIILILGYGISSQLSIDEIKPIFINTITVISVISLIGYIYSSFFIHINFLPIIETSTRNEKFTSLFFTNIPHFSWLAARNWGPFIEPGIFQVYLNFALLLCLVDKNKSLLKIFIFVVTILTTKSTAGLINLILIFTLVTINKGILIQKERLLFLVLFLLLISFFLGNENNFSMVFSKLLSPNEEARFLTVRYGLQVFLRSPLIGVGSNNVELMMTELNHGFKVSITNTWIFLLASNGIFFLGIILYNFWKSISNIVTNEVHRFYVFILIIVIFSSQNMSQSIAFNVILFLHLSKKTFNKEPKNKKEGNNYDRYK